MKNVITILFGFCLLLSGCGVDAPPGGAPSGEPYQLQSKYWDSLLVRRTGQCSIYLEIEQDGSKLKGKYYFLGDRSFGGDFEGLIGSETAEITLKETPKGKPYSDITVRLKVNEVCTPQEAQMAREMISVSSPKGKVPKEFEGKQIRKMGANVQYKFGDKEEMLVGFFHETIKQNTKS